jgi:tetratricopeptide (TPR) repeat protein
MMRLLATALASLFVLAPAVGAAQPAPPPPSAVACKDRREARRLFDQGHLAYRRGDYESAILRWQDSFSLCEEPLIFFNIHNAYEKLGQLKDALEYLRKWRENAPRREHQELDDKIDSLERRVREQDAADAARKQEEERRRREEEERTRAAQPPPDPGTPATSTDGAPLQIAGWTLVGFGGAAILAGVIMDGVAASTRPDETEGCLEDDGDLLCSDALRDDIESSNTLAIAGDVTWILGAVAAATGAGLLIYAELGGESADAALLVGPTSAGVRVRY